jgi:alkanesulfonate monooxygenase SsuD/methylene tetrahydromethanopterin reductase-like flavin-dependent oxidoreductase (luciferase family)
MTIGKWGVWFAPNRMPLEEVGRLADEVEAHGYDILWYPESVAFEAMALGGYYLGRTTKLNVASGIANIYAHGRECARP